MFFEPRVAFSSQYENIFLNDERVARYKFNDTIGQIDFGANFGRFAQARLGYLYDMRKVIVDVGSPLLSESEPHDAGVMLSAQYDSRDTAFAPTRGMTAAFEYMNASDTLGSDRNWQRAELGLGVAVPWRRNIWWITAAGGSGLGGDLPNDRAFTLGGPQSFPGFELNEMRVGGYWNLGTSYLWNVKDMLPVRNLALYAGVGVVGGAVYDRFDQSDTVGIYGGSFFLTGRTMVGPLTLGIGSTNTGSWSAWLSIGRPVGHGTILERGIFR
jgi:NTE family protein